MYIKIRKNIHNTVLKIVHNEQEEVIYGNMQKDVQLFEISKMFDKI